MKETVEISPLAQAFINYLNCPCQYFAPAPDDEPILEAFHEARIEGKAQGYTPVLVVVDEILWECLMLNSDEENDGNSEYRFNQDAVMSYRKAMLEANLPDANDKLKELIDLRKEEAGDDEYDWDKEIIGNIAKGYENDSINCLMHYSGTTTHEVILAKIPVSKPYEIFAYLPFGNWNECPDTLVLMTLAKYWYEKYGAQVVALSHDELEFELNDPLTLEQAKQTAVELYGFCPDCDQNFECIGQLVDTLTKSTNWYLWWD